MNDQPRKGTVRVWRDGGWQDVEVRYGPVSESNYGNGIFRPWWNPERAADDRNANEVHVRPVTSKRSRGAPTNMENDKKKTTIHHVCRLARQGMKPRQIKDRLGLEESVRTIQRWIADHG